MTTPADSAALAAAHAALLREVHGLIVEAEALLPVISTDTWNGVAREEFTNEIARLRAAIQETERAARWEWHHG